MQAYHARCRDVQKDWAEWEERNLSLANVRGREALSSQSAASLARSEAGNALERSEAMREECDRKVAEAEGKVREMEEEIQRVKDECEKRVELITVESRNSALKAVAAAKAAFPSPPPSAPPDASRTCARSSSRSLRPRLGRGRRRRLRSRG